MFQQMNKEENPITSGSQAVSLRRYNKEGTRKGTNKSNCIKY